MDARHHNTMVITDINLLKSVDLHFLDFLKVFIVFD